MGAPPGCAARRQSGLELGRAAGRDAADLHPQRRPLQPPGRGPAPVERVDLEPELSPPPRWMMMVAGAAVAALLGALLGGFMHI